jgi:cell surface protein SprA
VQLNFFKWIMIGVCSLYFIGAGQPVAYAQVKGDSSSVQPQSVLPDSLPGIDIPPPVSYPFIDYAGNFYYLNLQQEQTRIVLDSTGTYESRRFFNEVPVALPYAMSFDEYAQRSRQYSIRDNWQQLMQGYETSTDEQRGLLDFQFDIPASEKSAFATIFGKNEVNLSINGTANLNVGASIQNTGNPEIPENQRTQIDPLFNQNLKLNIQGTIGDKLSIRTDWDTEAAFDFQNRVNILYQGYENEILQQLELGNVSIETGNSLIRGGGALFGVKSVAQLGALRLTSVLSQQNGQTNTQTITGGAQEQNISIRPGSYENDRHFYLDFFTRQQFEGNVSNPQQLGQALQLSEVNVWVLRESSQSQEGERQAIALVDLGVIQNPDGTFAMPNGAEDAFSESLLNQFRDPSIGVSAGDFNVDAPEFIEGYFVPLQEGVDYEINRPLGYVSLKRNLGSRQALAVSFKYVNQQTGETVDVGEVSQGGGNRIYLKMLRPQTVTTTNAAYDLMMKNIYSLGANNVTQDGLEVDIKYTEGNVPASSLPGRNSILLQDLGLDRVDQQGALTPDNIIDFSTGTLDPVNGRIIFPYLQPFGDRTRELLQDTGLSTNEIDDIVFDELYDQTKVNANQNSKNNFYLVEGSSKGSVSANYSLGFSPVEGSVRVFANGKELQAGAEYTVDYSIGSVTILDEQYLRKGQEIKIEYENNQFSQIQQKTFTGVRAEYNLGQNFNIGTTYFRLNEKPVQDKIRLGNEPVNNTVIGLDANAAFDVPWLSRLIDKIPLLQTRAPSGLRISGEFAQLRPGVAQTTAVEEAIDDNRLFDDEERGLSFIDDFEGVDIGLSFLRPSRWNIAAAPAAVPGYQPDEVFFDNNDIQPPGTTLSDKIARSDLRSQFSWYTLPRNIRDILDGAQRTPETQQVEVTDVFPNRDVLSEDNIISTLDVQYNPQTRGPYNYNDNLKSLLEDDPQRTWGGMVTTLPSGQEDLTQNNIEFLEFWVQPILPGGRTPNAQDLQEYDGKIYIDIGVVSEDVVPNFKTNTEDGLARRPDDLEIDNFVAEARSFIPNPPPAPEGQFSNDTRSLEDVGLDGAPNTGGIDNNNEQLLFGDFIDAMRASYGAESEEFSMIQNDPSNDDYVYFGEDEVADLPLPERFYRLYGYAEGNTPANNGGDKRALTNRPDTEGLITPSIVQQNNSYFQYEVEINPADIDGLEPGAPGTFIIDEISGDRQQDRWYQVRVPLTEFVRKVGDINDFQNVSYIRLWMSGYEQPFTLRFATFELVGSQWRNADNVNAEQNSQAEPDISSINIEENSQREPIPYRQPEGAIRATDRSQQRQVIGNEQSIVVNAENLGPDELQMIKRVYPGGLNMLNYSNVRMFVHGEGYENREDLELVMRFGTDLVNNYYEYRQPITPTDPDFPFSNEPISELSAAEQDEEAQQVWLYDENSMNILLSAFNQLKQLRDQQGGDVSDRFERSDLMSGSPNGAVLTIKGNPSLDRVGEIGMGVRNPFDPNNPAAGGKPSIDAEVWLNELRVSGFDNQNGWAANGTAELQMADFATVNFNVSQQTDGFGALNSRLGQRRTSDEFAYDLNSTLNMHKFIPDRYGWDIPVSLSARRSVSTPRYLPNQGDVTFDDFEQAVNARNDISESEKDVLVDQTRTESQTTLKSYSLNIANATKNQSENPLVKYTLDKTNLNFVYNISNQRSPQYRLQNNWNYTGSLRYNINFNNTLLVRPFGFLGEVPLLNPLAGIKLGYTPASITGNLGVNRNYTEQRRREVEDSANPFFTQVFPLQQTHSFTYNTNIGFTYNLTPTIETGFQNRTVFDLSGAGVRDDGVLGTPDSLRFKVRPTFDVLGDLVTDTLSSRRKNYQEAYTAGWQPRLDKIEPINWVDYSANYTGGYQWRNSPQGSNLGATVTNNLSLNQTLDLDINNWLERMDWYQKLNVENGEENTSIAGIGREILQSLLSIQRINASFNITTSSLQTGYAGQSPFFKQFGNSGDNFSPSFSYRTGITDDIGLDRLIRNPNPNRGIQIPSNRNLSDNLTIGAQLRPFKNLSVDLSWNVQWDKTFSRSITIDSNQSSTTVFNQSGNVASSVWAFGNGYESFFKRQLEVARNDISSQGDTLSDATGNGDGRSVLGRTSLQESFRGAYLGVGTSVVGEQNFTPFPLPDWKITWSGLEDVIPYLGQFMSRASLQHAYSGRYRLGYVFNADQSLLPLLPIGNFVVQNRRPEYEPTTINIEKTFAPLIGLNITWLSDLRTNLQFDFSNLTSLALSNATVIERKSRGIRLTMNYSVQNFKIPLFPRIRNAVDFTVNTSYIRDTETKYVLSSDLDNALEQPANEPDPDFSSSFDGGQARINGSAIVGYEFSQTLKANFEYVYNQLIPKSTGVFPRTDHDIRFNLIVSIRSN